MTVDRRQEQLGEQGGGRVERLAQLLRLRWLSDLREVGSLSSDFDAMGCVSVDAIATLGVSQHT